MSAIELDDVGKRYLQYEEEALLVKRLLRPHRRRERRDLWALREISFRAEQGETVGIIGKNGSGKTTLLRLLSGVSAPTEGHLRVVGAVAPLIGIGVGFNSELTGRENVFVNGRLLGMSPDEVEDKYDAIVEFSEIEDFIDTPVKYYSSGMFLRLAFSVAIHTDPDIFLLDEILAVGDLAFQLKCNDRMREIQEQGATVVVVTHNLRMLNRLAPRAIVLDRGKMAFDGAVEDALGVYHEVMQRAQEDRDARTAALLDESGEGWYAGGAQVSVDLLDGGANDPKRRFATGDVIRARVRATFDDDVRDPILGLLVSLPGRGGLFSTFTLPGEYRGEHGPDRPLEATVDLNNRLLEGSYAIQAEVREHDGDLKLGTSEPELFSVTSRSRGHGVVDLEPRISIDGRQVELSTMPRLGER